MLGEEAFIYDVHNETLAQQLACILSRLLAIFDGADMLNKPIDEIRA